jgi:hypothetical protein
MANTDRTDFHRADHQYSEGVVSIELANADASYATWFGGGFAIDANNWVMALQGSANLFLRKKQAGTEGTMATTPSSLSTATVRWVVLRLSGSVVTAELWATDPTLGGTPTKTLSYTMNASEVSSFGPSVMKTPMWSSDPFTSTEMRIRQVRASSSVSFPTGKRCQNLRPWYPGNQKMMMASVDGDIYSVGSGGSFAQRFDGTAGTVWCFESAQDGSSIDYVWAMNGTDNPKKWDGVSGSAVDWANNPPLGTMCRTWKNRMVVSGVPTSPQRVFFSDIGNPESPAAQYGTNWVDIKSGDDDTDPITWLDLLDDFLIVFKRRSVWVVYDSNTFANRRLGTPGCEDRFQSSELLGRLYYLTRDGVYSIDNTGPPSYASGEIAPFFSEEANQSAIASARLLSTRDRRLLVAIPHSGNSTNSRLLELYPEFARLHQKRGEQEAPWMIHDLPVSAMANFRPAFDNVVVGADAGADEIHTLFEGLSDDGVAIDAHWFSSWKSFISEEPKERLRRLRLLMSGHCVADLYADLDDQVVKFSKEFQTTEAADPLWDGGVWDGGTWDPQASTELLLARPETRGRYHAVKLRNNVLDKTFTVYAIEFVLRGGKEH